MKRFFVLLLIAALIIGLVVFFTNPGMLDEVWLWMIGFAGVIVGFFRNMYEQVKDVFKKEEVQEATPIKTIYSPTPEQSVYTKKLEEEVEQLKEKISIGDGVVNTQTAFDGTTITVVRFMHDEETTLGLLYLRGEFVAYTLEDTYREKKIKGETRIPAGEYVVGFRVSDPPSGLTKKYRERKALKGIFTHHLEVKNVPGFDYIYIHIGNDHGDTDGCILMANGISANTVERAIVSSEIAYVGFYKKIQALLESGEKVRIIIHDEDWLQRI